MKNKYVFTAVLLAVILAVGTGLTTIYMRRQEPERESEGLRVVTSFYPVYIAAENVIGDCEGVSLSNLSEPQTGCLHDYQPTAEDMKQLSEADVFLVNGGGIETFLSDVAARYPDLTVVNISDGIQMSGENAHLWMSMKRHIAQVKNMAEGLGEADAVHADVYRENAEDYVKKIRGLADEASVLKREIAGRPVILFHEAYEYLAEDCGLEIAGLLNLDEERQVSAGEVADILTAIRERDVKVILAEELYGRDLGDMMAAQTGVRVLYLDTLVRGDYGADSYIAGMEQNIRILREALGGKP